MKLIESKAEYIPQEEGLEGIYKQIEICGRTCYKSLDKMTKSSARGFVERMINSNHTAMLEQGTVYLTIKWWHIFKFFKYLLNPYSKIHRFKYITTNYRVLYEHNWINDLQYICLPTKYHEKRYTLKFVTDRGVSHELVRHRVFSFAQESTRYCNYSKNKFGKEITFIIPSWCPNYDETDWDGLTYTLQKTEDEYFSLLDKGCTPQQARQILPTALKTEICMTGFASDWRFLMDLRLFEKTGAAHPDMLLLIQKAQKAMQEAGIWGDVTSKPSKFE